jgi:hypothetical protein
LKQLILFSRRPIARPGGVDAAAATVEGDNRKRFVFDVSASLPGVARVRAAGLDRWATTTTTTSDVGRRSSRHSPPTHSGRSV